MADIENQISKVVEVESKKLKDDQKFQKMLDFYSEMKKNGLVYQQKYNVSPLDTVGKRLYQSTKKAVKKRSC